MTFVFLFDVFILFSAALCEGAAPRTGLSLNSLSSIYFMHEQEELPLQDTRAGAPPSGAQRLCLQPDQKQYVFRANSKSCPHCHPQPSPPDVQVAGRTWLLRLDFTASLCPLIKAAVFHSTHLSLWQLTKIQHIRLRTWLHWRMCWGTASSHLSTFCLSFSACFSSCLISSR